MSVIISDAIRNLASGIGANTDKNEIVAIT